MLVYRDASVAERAAALADEVESLAAAVEAKPGYDAAIELLVTAGELEAAVLDTLECADEDAIGAALRDITASAARVLVAANEPATGRCASLCGKLRSLVHTVRVAVADLLVRRRVPEGYAYYALYPEAYATAARVYWAERRPRMVTVIGIRSIGTSLSAVVATELARCDSGLDLQTLTVRPTGHPFDRVLALTREAERLVRARVFGEFVVVDEGPGLSGSSFAAVADALSMVGVSEKRISFMPSWLPAPEQLRSERARSHWSRHRAYTSTFDAVWDAGRGIAEQWDAEIVADWSGGCWRDAHDDDSIPAVNAQHEQRKYLVRRGDELLVLKFAGLGRYGRRRAALSETLADAGYAPAVHGFHCGFLATAFVAGTRLTHDTLDRESLAHIGAYVAFRGSLEVARRGASLADLREMIETNVADEIGHFPRARELLSRVEEQTRGERAVANDARMLAHEWIKASSGLTKIDGVAHHDDHFLPGPQPVVWDIAGARAELELGADESRVLLEAFAANAANGHEPELEQRLPFYDVAYLALRIGYASMSAESCAASSDGPRWVRAESRYRERLRSVLASMEQSALPCVV